MSDDIPLEAAALLEALELIQAGPHDLIVWRVPKGTAPAGESRRVLLEALNRQYRVIPSRIDYPTNLFILEEGESLESIPPDVMKRFGYIHHTALRTPSTTYTPRQQGEGR